MHAAHGRLDLTLPTGTRPHTLWEATYSFAADLDLEKVVVEVWQLSQRTERVIGFAPALRIEVVRVRPHLHDFPACKAPACDQYSESLGGTMGRLSEFTLWAPTLDLYRIPTTRRSLFRPCARPKVEEHSRPTPLPPAHRALEQPTINRQLAESIFRFVSAIASACRLTLEVCLAWSNAGRL